VVVKILVSNPDGSATEIETPDLLIDLEDGGKLRIRPLSLGETKMLSIGPEYPNTHWSTVEIHPAACSHFYLVIKRHEHRDRPAGGKADQGTPPADPAPPAAP
jgi:hypothetical protein